MERKRETIWKVFGAVIYGESAGPLLPKRNGCVCFVLSRARSLISGVLANEKAEARRARLKHLGEDYYVLSYCLSYASI
jgi:hypothetical protein